MKSFVIKCVIIVKDNGNNYLYPVTCLININIIFKSKRHMLTVFYGYAHELQLHTLPTYTYNCIHIKRTTPSIYTHIL